MFPAYSKSNGNENADVRDDWLKNESFRTVTKREEEQVVIKKEVLSDVDEDVYSDTSSVIIEEVEPKKVECIVLLSSTSTEETEDESEEDEKKRKKKKKDKKKKKKSHHKKKDKKKKKKKRKKKYSSTEESEDEESSYSKRLEEIVFNDPEYRRIFDQVPKDRLNKAVFIEDIPDLTYKHAFRIDKRADMNNLCFDSVYHKLLPVYKVPEWQQNEKKRKQRRKEQLRQMVRSRYYGGGGEVDHGAIEQLPEDVKRDKIQHYRLSENLKLYFELKNAQLEKEKAEVNKTGDYNKYLNEHPNDVVKWLEFIEYQDTLAAATSVTTEETEEGTGLYKRKLAIFEKAVGKNRDNLKLNLEYIRYRATNNDTALDTIEKIEAEFQRLILIQLNRKQQDAETGFFSLFYIWFEYLKFMLSLTKFGASRVKKVSQKFFQFFLTDVNSVLGATSSLRVKCLFSHLMLYLIRFYCKFLSQCGFDEKVIGVYQALLDLNYTIIDSSSITLSGVKNLFELYYETNLPKFGEQYSTGWYSCLERRDELFKLLEEMELNRYENELDDLEKEIVYRDFSEMRVEYKWSALETLRKQYNWYPFYPQIQTGESADDCIDSDRLIKFDDDLGSLLLNFSFVFNDEALLFAENYRFRLIVQYFEHFSITAVNYETYESGGKHETDDAGSLNVNSYLKQMYTFDDDSTNDVYYRYLDEDMFKRFGLSLDVSPTLFDSYALHKEKSLIENFIQLKRLMIKQALSMARTQRLKENLYLLKWNFEFYLFKLYKKYDFMESVLALSASEFKLNFLSEVKADLSLNENRSSMNLWLQYTVLKYYMINSEEQVSGDYKEIRKVFEMLFKLPHLSRESSLNLCCIYIEIELGVYKRLFNMKQTCIDSAELSFELSNFGLYDYFAKTTEPNQMSKNNLIEMIVNYCLNRSGSGGGEQSASTFKIGLKNTTKDLLVDKELEQRFYSSITNNTNETLLFYKLYSYYLVLKGSINKLFAATDALLLKEDLIKSADYCEFYVWILNYLHYNIRRLKKNDYKTRLFHFINFVIKENSSRNKFLSQSLNLTLQVTLLKYKTELFDKIFGTQLIEVNDLDLIINSYIDVLHRLKLDKYLYQTGLTLVASDLYRINKIRKNIEFDDSRHNESVLTCLGFHNQLRRRFEKLLDYLPRSFVLWSLYFKFEFTYAGDLSSNKLMYIYYQSIRSLPFSKDLYIEAVGYVPEKFDEIVKWIANKDIRVRIPVEELDMMLEPLKSKFEVQNESESDEESRKEETRAKLSSGSGSIGSIFNFIF